MCKMHKKIQNTDLWCYYLTNAQPNTCANFYVKEEYENNISNNANDIGDDDNLSTDQANSTEEDNSQEKGMLCVRI